MTKTNTKTPTRGRKKPIDEAALTAANEASKTLGKQQQAAKEAPAKKTRSKPATTGLGKQRQSAADAPVIEKQGASASGKATDQSTEMRGGTKQVLITEAVVTGRGGRPAGVEEYPFGELAPARKEADGTIVGQSFFIPTSDRAEGRLAAARKRHREADGSPAVFWSRKCYEQVDGKGDLVQGLRIWRGTPKIKV